MSANADALQRPELINSTAPGKLSPQGTVSAGPHQWNRKDYACEQIRGLVRRVFFTSESPVKQVVFSAAEPHIDISSICDRVGRVLALETPADVAIVNRNLLASETIPENGPSAEKASIKSWATQTANNLWHVPEPLLRERRRESAGCHYWTSCLAELRNEFEFALIHGPGTGASSEAVLLGQMSDGIILVLDAHSTRRATARNIKETLERAQSRILGTVLCERTFPVPSRIYRRL